MWGLGCGSRGREFLCFTTVPSPLSQGTYGKRENVPSPPRYDGIHAISCSHGIVADEGLSALGLIPETVPSVTLSGRLQSHSNVLRLSFNGKLHLSSVGTVALRKVVTTRHTLAGAVRHRPQGKGGKRHLDPLYGELTPSPGLGTDLAGIRSSCRRSLSTESKQAVPHVLLTGKR